jgi:acyl transferase domain-containing protein/NAD(P)-dependent dehydrogenase (short-subunit alcohol dehydrogenase family)
MANIQVAGNPVFTFPGQGSFHGETLRELSGNPAYRAEFAIANETTKRILGHEFLPLAESAMAEERERILQQCPELDQVGIYVTDYLVAAGLMDAGLKPGMLLGHSFGELAALAIAGVFSFETGLRIVCQRSAMLRVIMLRQITGGGKMAAVSCDAARAAEVLRTLGLPSLEIVVMNHRKQTVIAGLPGDLEKLGAAVAAQGIGLTVLKSRYPFHSSMLRPAVEPFRLALSSYDFAAPSVPVYLCTERRFYTGGDLSVALSEQFCKQLNFAGLIGDLYEAGYRRFVECGAGNIVSKVTVESCLEGIEARAAAPLADGVAKGRSAVLKEFGITGAATTSRSAEVTLLAKEMRSLLERASRVLDGAPDSTTGNIPTDAAPVVAAVPVPEQLPPPEVCDNDPIAIVSLGCVLPGAQSPEQYWNNIMTGVSGIADLGVMDPTAITDFYAGSGGHDVKIVSDKTYTLLSGHAGKIVYNAELLKDAYSETQFYRLTRAEKLLAMASAQAFRGGLRAALAGIPEDRIECVLGATADGFQEYDYSVFEASMRETLAKVEPDQEVCAAFSSSLRRIWGEPADDNPRLAQSDSCEAVIQASAGRPIRTYMIDAACSSSLYAIGLGVTALQDHTKDVMLVGGVFAPAMANSALFAQFRGLSPTGSRPLDATADGVIFGEGSGLLVLKRLSDAIAAGDRIHGVVRGVGVSSDGKSPAINVPQSKGQSIAIRRAYENSNIDLNSIQYVEAHATATPVGDAVEFGALRNAITRDPKLPRIELASVKALIGHTGWAAGAASVIKLCLAFEKRTIPPQFHYKSPNPQINLEDSPFQISTSPYPWPANIGFLPRRAAINGFGFGGTNAHLILEEYHPAYHARLCKGVTPKSPKPTTLAVIDAAALFPSETGFEAPAPTAFTAFPRASLRLPKGKRLLPDVTEHMDPGQTLAMLAAERVLPALGESLKDLRSEIGVVIGVESKTERGITANQRIFLDRLKRLFAEDKQPDALSPAVRSAILEKVCDQVRKDIIPSGPYTLPGLMPNVISGRVANMFELNGPNVVIDMGENSLFQSIMVARDFLTHGECKAVLAGGLNAVRTSPNEAEAAFLMVLTTEETAKQLKLPVACLLTVGGSRPQVAKAAQTGVAYRGAEGTVALSEAIAKVRAGHAEISVMEAHSHTAMARELILRPTQHVVKQAPKPIAQPEAPVGTTYAYVQNTPIYDFTPVETAAALPKATRAHSARRILFLIDQPGHWRQLEKNGALSALNYHVLSAQAAQLEKSTLVDITSEEDVRKVLGSLPFQFDTIIPVKFLADGLPDTLLTSEPGHALGLTDLVFAVCRAHYEGLQGGSVSMGSLCLGAFIGGRLNPFTGLLAGFVKSLARELPAAICRSLNVEEIDFHKGMALLEAELSHRDPAVEVTYRGGNRAVIELAKIERISHGNTPVLTADSVVLATGAGRGVTAVLAEEILRRFGCTVVAIGRTNPAKVPAEYLAMDYATLANQEQEFYKTEMAKGGKKITQLRDQFRSYQAGHEVNEIVKSLSSMPGRFEYISSDITNHDATTAIVEQVYRKYGRIDMVLHGAGIQISKLMTKKTVADFHSVVGAKILSLQTIYQACERLRAGKPVHYHLLTSAFSYMGNDGQPDYGAVNESLNRLADVMDAAPAPENARSRWASVAWLGWAGIGMTRGSEFAALAANRGLRGITKSEGQEIFSHFLTGEATAPINILMADGELKFYSVATTPGVYQPKVTIHKPSVVSSVVAKTTRRNSIEIERTVTADSAPYILNHLVDGIPTLPGAFLIMMIAEAALELRPELKITAFEDAAFRRFVRLRSDGPTKLRLNVSVVSEDELGSVVRVHVVSDFTHKSGKILQKDLVQTELSVRMGPAVISARKSNGNGGSHKPALSSASRSLSDPYVMSGSPVQLNGPFRTLNNILVGDTIRSADYRPSHGNAAFLSSLMVMDSLWRFGAIDRDSQNTLPVYVPEACKVMNVYYDLSDPGHGSALAGHLSMTGSNPTADQDRLVIGPVEVRDHAGSVLLTVEGGICRRLGEVRDEN